MNKNFKKVKDAIEFKKKVWYNKFVIKIEGEELWKRKTEKAYMYS